MVESPDKFSINKLCDQGARKVWLAAILGIIYPGLGQLYNGQAIIAFGVLAFNVVAHFLIAIPNPDFPIIMILASVLVYLAAAIQAIIRAKKIRANFIARKWNNWILYMLYFMLGIILTSLPGSYLYGIRQISTDCMTGKFQSGDILFVERYQYLFSDPQEGDIVVVRLPEENGRISIGRIWAAGGKEIMTRDNAIFLDGNRIVTAETPVALVPRVKLPGAEMVMREDSGSIKIPQGSFLVIGDNSYGWGDETCCGIISKADIEGKAGYIYLAKSEVSSGAELKRLLFYLFLL